METVNDLRAKTTAIRAKAASTVMSLLGNGKISESARNDAIVATVGGANRQLTALKKEAFAMLTERKETTRRALVGKPKDAVTYRDALARADAAGGKPADLSRLLTRAVQTGDEEQARAVVAIAIELYGDSATSNVLNGILGEYVAAYPERKFYAGDFLDASAAASTETTRNLNLSVVSIPLPRELSGRVSGRDQSIASGAIDAPEGFGTLSFA